ncbi:hypothetical protein ACP70R_022317 [Stipagrostis hirtigluma subsp. patula]
MAINQPAAPATNDALWSLYDLINARVSHRDGKETDPATEECSRNGSNLPDTQEQGWSLGDVVSVTNTPGDDTGPPDQGISSPKFRIYQGALYD